MSKQTKKDIDKATDVELLEFAELTLQIEAAAKARTREDVIGLIRASGYPADFIFVDAAEIADADESQSDDVRAEAQVKLSSGLGNNDPKWIIRIAGTELPGGKEPVPVGVNGRVLVIQRNMEVEVPHRYVEAIRNAVRVSIQQDPKTMEYIYSNFTNYPLEVIDRPSRAEIEAFRERTKDEVMPA